MREFTEKQMEAVQARLAEVEDDGYGKPEGQGHLEEILERATYTTLGGVTDGDIEIADRLIKEGY